MDAHHIKTSLNVIMAQKMCLGSIEVSGPAFKRPSMRHWTGAPISPVAHLVVLHIDEAKNSAINVAFAGILPLARTGILESQTSTRIFAEFCQRPALASSDADPYSGLVVRVWL